MSPETLLLIADAGCTAELFGPLTFALAGRRACKTVPTGFFQDVRMEAGSILRQAPQTFALLGHGLGATIALDIMRQAPTRVTRLALLGGRVARDSDAEIDEREALIALAEADALAEVQVRMWESLVSGERVGDALMSELVQRMRLDVGAGRFASQQRAMSRRQNYHLALSNVRVPTLVLTGADDVLAPPGASRSMADAAPGAELVIVPRCGHLAPIEQPHAVAAAVLRWLAR
jgi:pimeloyl-ACP methyl ester carboxylesterase